MSNKIVRFSKLSCALIVALIALSACGSSQGYNVKSANAEQKAAVVDIVSDSDQEADDIQLGAPKKPRINPVRERL